MKKTNPILFFITLLVVFSSCMKNEICNQDKIELKAGSYTITEIDGIIDTVAIKIDVDSIYGLKMEEHNLLLNVKQIDEISFPLDDTSNETSFVLSLTGTIDTIPFFTKDTIQFFYEKHLLFNSVKCGVSYTYTITDLKFSTHLLQNIILTNPEIDVNSAENILLVF